MPEGPVARRAPDAGRPGTAKPRLAILSHSTGEYDARSIRVARSALAAGYEVTMYSRWSPGLDMTEERNGYTLVRVPTTGWLLVPGFRRIARRRLARQVAAGRLAPVGSRDGSRQAPQPQRGRPAPGQGGTPASASRVLEAVRRWHRVLLMFPLRPLAWAEALEDVAQPADLWHGMWAGSLPALWRLKRRFGGRTIYDSRDVYLHSRDFARLEWPFRPILARLERRWAADVDQVITVNEPYVDLIATQLRVPRPLVILNCPEAWTPPSPPPDHFRNALGIPADTAIVLYQGQLISDRGIEQLLDAILEVPGAVLCLLGYGGMTDGLRALSANAPYRGKVRVLPAVPPDDLLAWTASADVMAMPIQPTTPNHRFTTPQKLWEAIAAGVPIVASDLPAMAEVVTAERIGQLCDPTSPASIAAAIRAILELPADERSSMRAHILRLAHARYNWEAQARVLFGIYDVLLARPEMHDEVRGARRTVPRDAGLARRAVRGARRRARRWHLRSAFLAVARLSPGSWLRRPGDAFAIVRAEATGSRSPAIIPAVDRLLRHDRPTFLVARRARMAVDLGDLTVGHALWAELAARDMPGAERSRRLAEGKLIETDPSWLPRVAGEPERLVPVSRRRVLHIAKSSVPDRWSGFTIRTLNNMRAQRAAGLDPLLVTELGWPRTIGVHDPEPVVAVDGLAHYRLDRGPGYDLAAVPNDVRLTDIAESLVPLVRELRPAILHAHSGHRGGEHALVALALRERLGIPVVYEVRGLFESVWHPDEALAMRSELYARRLAQETRILHEVDRVLAISEALMDELASRGIPRAKMSLLPNGIDPDAFAVPRRDRALRADLGFDGRFVVGYVGNLDHHREGISVLISALDELRRRGRDEIAALVVGDGPRRASLEALAGDLGLADRCRFTGRVPHEAVAGYYAQMDLFACPRIEERAARYITPLKPYEAMALGLPVLVSDLPALTEIVEPPHRGFVAPTGDPIGLADAIERIADDVAVRTAVAAAGREWVLRERTWMSNGPRYRAAYEAIIGPID